MGTLDEVIFIAFIVCVIGLGLYKSRNEKTGEDYFLAGRKLTWWIIGGSLIAANISTHHFIGMSGQGFSIGLAIASYEWLAAVTLILVGKFFLPIFIDKGLYRLRRRGASRLLIEKCECVDLRLRHESPKLPWLFVCYRLVARSVLIYPLRSLSICLLIPSHRSPCCRILTTGSFGEWPWLSV